MPQGADAICKLHLMKTAIPRCCFETAPPKQIAKLHLTKRNCQTAPRKGVVLKVHLLKKLQFPNCTLARCSFQTAPWKGVVLSNQRAKASQCEPFNIGSRGPCISAAPTQMSLLQMSCLPFGVPAQQPASARLHACPACDTCRPRARTTTEARSEAFCR